MIPPRAAGRVHSEGDAFACLYVKRPARAPGYREGGRVGSHD